MKKLTLTKLLALSFAGCLQYAQASTLAVNFPGNSLNYTTTVGSSFDASIYASGFANLGFFDFSIIYDSTKLSALSLDSASIFGTGSDTTYFLTDAGGNFVPYTITNAAGKGNVHFTESISGTSALNTSGFDATQSTLLGTLHFKALATGVNSQVTIDSPSASLTDAAGNTLAGVIQGALVTINQPAAVPLPAAFWLFAPGLLAVFGKKRLSAAG